MRAAMYTFATLAAIASLAGPARADQQSDRASLIGSWVQSGGNNAWIIDNAADGLHIKQIEGAGTVADYQCNLQGHDCDVKVSGHKAAISDVLQRRHSRADRDEGRSDRQTPLLRAACGQHAEGRNHSDGRARTDRGNGIRARTADDSEEVTPPYPPCLERN